AMDVIWCLELLKIKEQFRLSKSPSGCHWLHAIEYRYGRSQKGMFIDGHKRANVV
ncbi:hypothetical protein M422DRAFT_129662, partial [Sphaerobolus stellatus SS14]